MIFATDIWNGKQEKKLIAGYVSPRGVVNHFVFMAFRVYE
jgi:hypothetical protein